MVGDFEPVIGLEVHARLRTRTKLFCGCRVRFADPPNSHTCPVCLGLPGALPAPNRVAVDLALRAAVALGCRVSSGSRFARKSYYYPDLPKGYQISQYDRPLGLGGGVEYWCADRVRTVSLERVHLEEDAGKSIHQRARGRALLDLNRAGAPLLEIVTRPALSSAEEASSCLQELRALLRAIGVADANMQEGSLRCDANISLRGGDGGLNPKVEIKNLNSFRHLRQALRHERRRQGSMLAAGITPQPCTRQWDERARCTRELRDKETSADYRYFADPDLPALGISEDAIEAARARVPELPLARAQRLARCHGLDLSRAVELARDRDHTDYFERLVAAGLAGNDAWNWLSGPIRAHLNVAGITLSELELAPEAVADLHDAVQSGSVSRRAAAVVLDRMIGSGVGARAIIKAEGLELVSEPAVISELVEAVLQEQPDAAARYRAGELELLGYLVGEVMHASGGRASPELVRRTLEIALADPSDRTPPAGRD